MARIEPMEDGPRGPDLPGPPPESRLLGGIPPRTVMVAVAAVVVVSAAFGFSGAHGTSSEGAAHGPSPTQARTEQNEPTAEEDPLGGVALPSVMAADPGQPLVPDQSPDPAPAASVSMVGPAPGAPPLPGAAPKRQLPDGPLPPSQLPGGPPMAVPSDRPAPRLAPAPTLGAASARRGSTPADRSGPLTGRPLDPLGSPEPAEQPEQPDRRRGFGGGLGGLGDALGG